jgi:hypothetical protein
MAIVLPLAASFWRRRGTENESAIKPPPVRQDQGFGRVLSYFGCQRSAVSCQLEDTLGKAERILGLVRLIADS